MKAHIFCLLINLFLVSYCYATKESFSSKIIGFGDQDDARLISKVMNNQQHQQQQQQRQNQADEGKKNNNKEKFIDLNGNISRTSSELFAKRYEPIHLHESESNRHNLKRANNMNHDEQTNLNLAYPSLTSSIDLNEDKNFRGELLPVENVIWLPASRYSSLTTRKYLSPYSDQTILNELPNTWISSDNSKDNDESILRNLLLSISNYDYTSNLNAGNNLNYLARVARSRRQQQQPSQKFK